MCNDVMYSHNISKCIGHFFELQRNLSISTKDTEYDDESDYDLDDVFSVYWGESDDVKDDDDDSGDLEEDDHDVECLKNLYYTYNITVTVNMNNN
ncbi:uncharacterized protein [Parasteatoda tepidariorum]|uniref:uncharacterized protein isoform X2 n=1 Tax=Parasteatoda tepidariorum TaxID=114398 RepID=UPI001C7225E7|nr:putative uncharacterized protein DDB_G0270496 [Parasteatoda tepidariorum]